MDNLYLEWLKFSDMDLTTAEHIAKTLHPTPLEIICYHCQQSAEKALKGFLIFAEVRPNRTHDLEMLRSACEEVDKTFSEIAKQCMRLNDYSSQPRYPMEIEITDGDMKLALIDSEYISRFVKEKIK